MATLATAGSRPSLNALAHHTKILCLITTPLIQLKKNFQRGRACILIKTLPHSFHDRKTEI